MSNESVSMVISNCEFTHNPNIAVMLHEENDKDKFIPDGITIAYVKSNFCELYHKNYMYLDKKYMEQYECKSNKGRKRLEKQSKRQKSNCGSGNEFGSSVAFGLIHENHVYEMRVFRKTTIGVSGLKSNNIEFIKLLINKLIDYMNSVDPTLMIKLKDQPKITLCNLKYHFHLPVSLSPDEVIAFNLHRLKGIILNNYSDAEYWDPIKNGTLTTSVLFPFNESTAFYTMNVKCNETYYYFKFYNNGKLNIYGGNNSDICETLMKKFVDILKTHEDELVQQSIPSGPTEIEHEY